MNTENAIFCFTIVPKHEPQLALEVIKKAVQIADGTLDQEFNRFYVYLEASSAYGEIPHEMLVDNHRGTIAQVNLPELQKWRREKLADEEKARKKPGHTSHVPKSILQPNTCVVVVGSGAFCSAIACMHMQELEQLRGKLIVILDKLFSLKPVISRAKISHEDLLVVPVQQDDKNYLTYNLNYMAEMVEKPKIGSSLAELLANRETDT